MNKYTKIRMFRYEIVNKLRLLEGEDLANEIDKIIEELQQKKLDKFGPFKQFIDELESYKIEAIAKPKLKSREYDPFEIPFSGVGRIVFFGLSNVGKSTLMNCITNTQVKIGNYLNTTKIGQAGACTFEDIVFQIVDLPGFLDFKDEWNTHKQIVRVARTSDVIILVIDLTLDIDRQLTFLINQLNMAKILIDGESSHKIAIIATKGDVLRTKESYENLIKKVQWPVFPTAYNNEASLIKLKESLFKLLELIRVYTKPPGEKADLTQPFVVPKGCTVKTIAEKIHTNFLNRFKYARLWGTSSEFSGQQVGLDHELQDKDILELVLEKQ